MHLSLAFSRLLVGGCLATLGTMVSANTITFETTALGFFTGPMTEDGFTFSTASGGLFVNLAGNPHIDVDANDGTGGGTMKIVAAGGGNFSFDSVDFAALGLRNLATGSQILRVEGFLGGSSVGVDQYTNTNDDVYVTEVASVLAGKSIAELDITMSAGLSPDIYYSRIDNVVLTPEQVSVPEPFTFALLVAAFAGIGWARRLKLN